MLAGSMPNSTTWAALVDTATKWRATAASPRAPTSQARAVRALVSVSSVVNVLDDTTKSVSAGSRSRVAWWGGPPPPPHGLDAAPQVGPGGERGQEADRLGREPVLGVVEVQVAGLDGHRLAPFGVGGEELPEVGAGQGGVVVGQRLPFRRGGDVECFAHGVRSSAVRRCPVSL